MIENIKRVNDFLRENPGKKVVFTNGVFDILHKGHIEVLEFSKSLGDVLIVGINSDISVKIIKGQNRPILNLENRMSVLNSIRYVDFVIPFDNRTPIGLIEQLERIDSYVKGGDYNMDNLPEREVLLKRNAEVIFFKFKSDISTSKIVNDYCLKIIK